MKLVTVEASFAPEHAGTCHDLFSDHAPEVRQMPGCEAYELYAAPADQGKIVIVQRWSSMDSFDQYRQSEAFAALGQGLKPIMAGPPVTTLSTVDA